ncbi:hypothetical protein EYF80_009223 [Liparis tanakae]|uniref:Uncharacterized protein n=1 Tax=Liparis tanakae TaxID=230148 RepID=A0A4Z2ISJ1_9TELE|nr:hypothetical protein EYF80_009223 [Liparis tanakae]
MEVQRGDFWFGIGRRSMNVLKVCAYRAACDSHEASFDKKHMFHENTVCPSTMVNAPIPGKEMHEYNQKDAFHQLLQQHHSHICITWKYEILQYFRPSRSGIDEAHVCTLQ